MEGEAISRNPRVMIDIGVLRVGLVNFFLIIIAEFELESKIRIKKQSVITMQILVG